MITGSLTGYVFHISLLPLIFFFSFFSLVFNRLNSSDAYVDKHPDVWMFLGIFISNIKNAFPYIS